MMSQPAVVTYTTTAPVTQTRGPITMAPVTVAPITMAPVTMTARRSECELLVKMFSETGNAAKSKFSDEVAIPCDADDAGDVGKVILGNGVDVAIAGDVHEAVLSMMLEMLEMLGLLASHRLWFIVI